MSSSKRAALRAGVLGLMVGCVPAVWLVGWVAAAPPRPAKPAPPPPPALPPGCLSPAEQPGGQLQLGQFGQYGQLGQPYVSTTDSPADEELRMRFPFESLADRLVYEKEARKRPANKVRATVMTKDTRTRLSALEDAFQGKSSNDRTLRLAQLHTDQVVRFVRSPGFGYSRIGSPEFNSPVVVPAGPTGLKVEDLELPDASAIPFASVRVASADDDGKPAADAPPPKRKRLEELHINGLLDFLDPVGFGYVKDRDHVAGFEPHQFRHLPELPPESGEAGGMEKWAVVRLELVSLLKHDHPLVYASDVLPSMTDANRPDTRELTAFEGKGLSALRQGDDLATESSGDRIRMMGSLRAGKQCLDCHGVKRGDLLGAFSWELQRQTVDDRTP